MRMNATCFSGPRRPGQPCHPPPLIVILGQAPGSGLGPARGQAVRDPWTQRKTLSRFARFKFWVLAARARMTVLGLAHAKILRDPSGPEFC